MHSQSTDCPNQYPIGSILLRDCRVYTPLGESAFSPPALTPALIREVITAQEGAWLSVTIVW